MIEVCSLAGERQLYTTVGYYKAIRVAVKKLQDAKYELNRAKLLELKMMKDLSNDHLVKFYGACLDSPNCCILTEYCPRGSLQVGNGIGRAARKTFSRRTSSRTTRSSWTGSSGCP